MVSSGCAVHCSNDQTPRNVTPSYSILSVCPSTDSEHLHTSGSVYLSLLAT
jgi:hypothetical protein